MGVAAEAAADVVAAVEAAAVVTAAADVDVATARNTTATIAKNTKVQTMAIRCRSWLARVFWKCTPMATASCVIQVRISLASGPIPSCPAR